MSVEMATIRLSARVTDAIRRHAAAAYPHECCGALIGAVSEARARELGAELVGVYHSHPDHPARPSQYDLDHAWPNFSYVIVAVAQGEPGDLRSWRLRPDRSGFSEETLS